MILHQLSTLLIFIVLADNLIIPKVIIIATKVKSVKDILPKITNPNHSCERNTQVLDKE